MGYLEIGSERFIISLSILCPNHFLDNVWEDAVLYQELDDLSIIQRSSLLTGAFATQIFDRPPHLFLYSILFLLLLLLNNLTLLRK